VSAAQNSGGSARKTVKDGREKGDEMQKNVLGRRRLAGLVLAMAVGTGALAAVGALAAEGPGGSTEAPAPPPVESGPEQVPSTDLRNAQPSSADVAAARAIANSTGSVRVIVGLRLLFTPEGQLSEADAADQVAAIAAARRQLLAALPARGVSVNQTYDHVPYIALTLTANALSALVASGRAASLQIDELARLVDAVSTPLVEGTEAKTVGRSGFGKVVAILDTGVDKAHPFLAGKVVSEACFSGNGNCPNGLTVQIGVGAGVPCTYAVSACRHGTHVAGIAAGKRYSTMPAPQFDGVAPEAKLISVQVFSRFTGANCAGAGEDPCALSYTSDQIKGLDQVFSLRNSFSIASVNMSLGGGKSTVNCDADSRKPSIDNLRSVGIATAIASGNNGFTDGVSFPACISTAITVGSTTTSDVVSSFSNSSPLVELLAPGSSITSSVPGGGFAVFSGTSMATPHVAGAWAVLKQVSPGASVASVLSALQLTGKPITDSRNGVTKPRIRVLSGSVQFADTGFRSYSVSGPLAGLDVASGAIGLAVRGGSSASGNIVISGIPAGSTVQFARLVWMTIGGPDATVVFKGASTGGTLIGAARDTNWNINQHNPNRTYYRTLSSAVVPGNGSYSISGVGGVGGADGQGAWLIVYYKNPAVVQVGRAYTKLGALGMCTSGGTMAHTFSGISVPSTPSKVRLHVGMADGQDFTEDPMYLGTTPVTGADAFFGGDGPFADHYSLYFAPSHLPAGATSISNSLKIIGDCLAWPYAVLYYRSNT
jgi:subtilisin